MKKIILYVTSGFILSGCAKFDFFQGSFSSVSSLQVLTPTAGSALVPSTTFTITGTCDPLGGNVDITGSSFTEPLVSGPCDPVLGTFSINATAAASGQNLDIQASQLDAASVLLNSNISTIMIHCAGLAMISCAINGSGNPIDPYIVGNISCLQEMRVGLSCHYALNNNIDASATSTWNFNGTNFRGWEPVPVINNPAIRFTGTLDGRNRTISNLYVTPRDINGGGLFSRIHDEGNGVVDEQVFDLTLLNPSSGLLDFNVSPFGILSGTVNLVGIRNVDIINGTIDLTVADNRESIGLLVGRSLNSEFLDSSTSGTISFNGSFDEVNTKFGSIGGFIGFDTNGTFTNNSSNINMNTNLSNIQYFTNIGGAIGYVLGSTIDRFSVTSNIDLYYGGLNAFSSRGISTIGGFAGWSSNGANYNRICINTNLNFESVNSNTLEIGGFIGRMADIPSLELNDQVSVRGQISAEGNGNEVTNLSGYVGTDYGPSTHSNIFLDLDLTISNATVPPFFGYGGIISGNDSSSSFSNIVTISSHNIDPAIPQGGAFALVNGSPVSSIYYADDPSLGGLPAEAAGGPTAGITSRPLSNLALIPDGTYGFDFAAVWQRDGVTNIPELRYCP